MYNPPSDFDKDGWKKAFDISNAFAYTSEKHRANRENLATSDWRVQNVNNGYQTGIEKNNLNIAELQRQYGNALATDPSAIQATIAKNNYDGFNSNINLEKLRGTDELARIEAKYRYDPLGRIRDDETVRNLALQNGDLTAPYAIVDSNQHLQQYYTNMAQKLASVNPNLASQYGYQSGVPFLVEEGNLVSPEGRVVAQNFTPEQTQRLYAPPLSPKVAEAQGIAEARLPYTLQAIEARAQNALEKQQAWKEHKSLDADWKVANGFIDNVFSNTTDPVAIRSQIGTLVSTYPHLKEEIARAVQLKLSQGQQ